MGTRSWNYLVIKPEINIDALKNFLNEENSKFLSADAGILIIYETNFTPMYARPDLENCTTDLEQEIGIQRFLGSIPVTSYSMMRAGDECDFRGKWIDHPFAHDDDVIKINFKYAKQMEHSSVAKNNRALIIVNGGVADFVCDEGVEVAIFDWDNHNDDPGIGVPTHFSDLAGPLCVPVQDPVVTKRPKP